jgi:AbrB family looped-hinge helix DNA binding protein
MPLATLSTKNQIVISREAREALRVKAGDKLLVVVRGDRVIVLQKPKAHHTAIRGLSKYPDNYIRKERKSREPSSVPFRGARSGSHWTPASSFINCNQIPATSF